MTLYKNAPRRCETPIRKHGLVLRSERNGSVCIRVTLLGDEPLCSISEATEKLCHNTNTTPQLRAVMKQYLFVCWRLKIKAVNIHIECVSRTTWAVWHHGLS